MNANMTLLRRGVLLLMVLLSQIALSGCAAVAAGAAGAVIGHEIAKDKDDDD